jgi:transposase
MVADVPHGHWKTTTLVAGLCVAGMIAPMVVEGAMDGKVFLAYVQQQLVKSLRPGRIVVMDNVAFHKVAGVREAIESAGCSVVYLPPYSPDYNPIESAFSKLKWHMRSAGKRDIPSLWSHVGGVTEEFTPTECRNRFRHCGYSAECI